MGKSLGDEILVELKRARELLVLYAQIPTGGFGVVAINEVIDRAEKALSERDLPAIIEAYEELKGLK